MEHARMSLMIQVPPSWTLKDTLRKMLSGHFKPIKNRSLQIVFDRSLFMLRKDPVAHLLNLFPLFTRTWGRSCFLLLNIKVGKPHKFNILQRYRWWQSVKTKVFLEQVLQSTLSQFGWNLTVRFYLPFAAAWQDTAPNSLRMRVRGTHYANGHLHLGIESVERTSWEKDGFS